MKKQERPIKPYPTFKKIKGWYCPACKGFMEVKRSGKNHTRCGCDWEEGITNLHFLFRNDYEKLRSLRSKFYRSKQKSWEPLYRRIK